MVTNAQGQAWDQAMANQHPHSLAVIRAMRPRAKKYHVVPVNTALPVISGSLAHGSALTVSNGTWSNSPTSYTYQWLSGGTVIPGQTTSSYTTVAGDVGKQITAKVTAKNAVGSATATAAGVGPIT